MLRWGRVCRGGGEGLKIKILIIAFKWQDSFLKQLQL